MKISHLGNNIQTIRKFRGMKQQELADKIGINMQSLSKIERGLNYPAYETLEKIMEVLDVTPNELLSGEWKYINQSEKEICQFLRAEERLNAELKHGHYDRSKCGTPQITASASPNPTVRSSSLPEHCVT